MATLTINRDKLSFREEFKDFIVKSITKNYADNAKDFKKRFEQILIRSKSSEEAIIEIDNIILSSDTKIQSKLVEIKEKLIQKYCI